MTEDKKPIVEGEVVDEKPQADESAEQKPIEQSAERAAEQPKKILTIRDTTASNFMDPNVYLQMKSMAHDFVKSKAIPSGWTTPEQVLVAMQTGYEMGMKPMEALKSLYPVNGIINVWGQATVRRLTEHGWRVDYSEETDLGVTAEISKMIDGKKVRHKEHFSFKEAQDSGYVADNYGKLKVGWRNGINRKLKMRYNCLSLIIKTYVPEVLGSAVDIVEVAQDTVPMIQESIGTDPKIAIKAAEEKRKQLTGGSFKPKAVAAQEAPEK